MRLSSRNLISEHKHNNMMDILATQVYEDDSFTPTQQLSHSLPHNIKEKHIGTLRIGPITYPIQQGITKIGRHPECDIVLNDQTVSKKHAEIEVNSDETWICDLNSSNKTKLNSSVLRSGRYYELKGGSVVEFGMVRAVYSVLDAMDESLIPQTPAISDSGIKKMIIPVTPDTSMNFSSTSEGDVSIVPGTQAEKEDSIFRRPSVPVRGSASSQKSYLLESSHEDSMNDSRGSSALGKENVGENRVSTHDMETQNSFESQSNLSDDIHDVQTQKICLDNFLAAKQSRDQTDIHNMETQHEEDVDTQHFVTDIHDVETQHDIDIDDLDTLRKTEVQNALVGSDKGASAVEKGQTEEAKLKADVSMEAGKSDIKEEESCSNAVDRPEKAVAAKDENSGNSEQLENGQRGSQDCLELSIVTNFDDECSELDRTSSQNLLENLISDDDPANVSGSKSVSPLKSFANNNETTEKSSDEENIFDMATQANANYENVLEGVTKRIDYTFKAPLMEDDSDDDTDQEGVFQRYSRIASQDSSQGTVLSKSQPDSEDSDTDEEGHFAAMAMKEKRTSLSFEVGQNESKETKNDAGSSQDSDDLFDIATQKVNLENSSKEQGDVNKNSVDFNMPTQLIEANKPEDVVEKGSTDFDTPTQVIEMSKPEDVASKGNVDFDTPTQVIDTNQPVNVTEKGSVSFDTPMQLIEANKPEDIVEKGNADFDTPTQVIEVSKPEDVANKGCVDFDTPTQVIDTNQPVNVTEKGSVSFDTPMQLIEANEPEDVVEEGNADFDTPTQVIDTNQPVNVTEKGSVSFDTPTQLIEANEPEDVVEEDNADFSTPTQVIEVSKPEDVANEGSVDFDTPTQVIDTNQPVNVTGKGSVSFDIPTQLIEDTNKDEDDSMPTQILPIGKISRNVVAAAKGNTTRNEDEDEGETNYNTPTQIIAENVPIYKEPSPYDFERENPHLVEEFSMEDMDYAMAPTQLLIDIEEKKQAALANKKHKSGKLNRVNLDDTVERNLNEMFDDINEDIEDDLPRMSTQVLTNMLESPQNNESADVNVDKELPGSSKEKTSPRRSRGKSTGAKLEVSPLLTSRKSRRSSSKKAITNSSPDSSNLTTKRKRNLLADSQESTDKTLNDEDNISAALLKSSPKNSPSTRFSRTNKPEELKMPEPVVESVELVKGNKNVAVELDRGDEISITSVNTGQFGRAITQDSDEDIMAGLPEVQISGTLSNPASPASSTSTEFRYTTRSMKPKSGTKKTEPKKKVLPKKSTRKSVPRTNAENNEPPKVGRLRSTAFSSSFENFNISRVPETIHENDEDIVNEIKPSNRTSSRKSKESGSLQTKPNPSYAEVRRSPSIQDNGRTRGSSKEYNSSVFQVGKEALVITVAEPVRKTAVKTTRAVKRSLSSTDITESNNAKKRKENVTEKASVATKGRRSTRGVAATRSNSANILDYMSRRDSPVLNSDSSQQSISSNQESFGPKQLRIKIRRLSSDTPPLLIPTKSAKEDSRVSVNSAISNSSKAENDKSTIVEEKVYPTRGNRSKITASKSNVEDDSSQMGEESQEVEMIMNSWVKEENVKQKETNESTIVEEKVYPTRGNRSKRAARKRNMEDDSSQMGEEPQEVEMTMNSGVKEENVKQKETNESTIVEEKVYPTRGNRSKRAASKRNVLDDSSQMEEEPQEVEMTMNSGVKEENVKQKETNESTIVEEKVYPIRGNRSKRVASKRNVEDDSSQMGEEPQEVEMTVNSGVKEENVKQEETNESTKGARGRGTRNRSMNSSFTTSTPIKIKHKILFTGITKDYSKLLAKLGSSQVEDPAKCTVLVTDKVRRTVKFLCALAQAVPIVSVSWLVDSEKAGRFAELDNYILKDPAAEAKFGFRLRGSLEKAKKQKLLDGYTIVLTPNVAPPPVQELKSIISSCGGKPLVRPPPSWPQNAVIISREEDIASAKKFLAKASKTVTIQSTEFILTGILRQELDFVKYKLT